MIPFWRLGGRSFLLIVFFAVTGFFLATRGRLTGHYVELVAALSGFHVSRAIAEDRSARKKDAIGSAQSDLREQA